MELLVPGAIFALVFAITFVLLNLRRGERERKEFIARRMMRPVEKQAALEVARGRKPRSEALLEVLYRFDLLHALEENMWQAGIRAELPEVLLIMVLLFAGGWAGGRALWGDAWFATASGAALAAVPVLYIRWRRRRRFKAFAAQLPFALDLIKSSLEAGHGLPRAIQTLTKEFAEPLAGEFRTALEQTRIGLPLGRAMEEMFRRIPEDALRLLVVAIKVQNDVGGSLAGIVGRLAEIVRLRQRLRLQIKALTAQGRMGGIVVGLLPVLVLGAFSLIRPDYTRPLFYDPTGLKILKTAVGLDLMALLTIRRLLRVDY